MARCWSARCASPGWVSRWTPPAACRPAAIERTLSVLREYRRSMDAHGVSRARLVATSAVRDAGERRGVHVRASEAITGVHPEVLSGDEEGRLSFAGATAHLPPSTDGRDRCSSSTSAGGRPSSPSDARARRRCRALEVVARSLDIGCVRVSERFSARPAEHARTWHGRVPAVTEEVVAAQGRPPAARTRRALVGLAGTVSTLACLEPGHRCLRPRPGPPRRARPGTTSSDGWTSCPPRMPAPVGAPRHGRGPGGRHRRRGPRPRRGHGVVRTRPCLVSEDDILDGLAAELAGLGALHRMTGVTKALDALSAVR